MSANFSSSSNDSLLHPDLSSKHSNLPIYIYCLMYRPSSFIFTIYFTTTISLLLPLCIFVIYHGLQQWRQKRSTSSAATMSHSDSFTYHMIAIELIGIFGCMFLICGLYRDHLNLFLVGFFLFSFIWFAKMFLHALTCVERYLAVVHPITYLSLRKERGIRIRNITTGCVWLLCSVMMSLVLMEHLTIILNFGLLIVSFTVVSFCSLSVLRVLNRSGPGEQGGDRERVDQSKQRAFNTIMAILGVLVVRFVWSLAWSVLSLSGRSTECVIIISGIWLNLPSSLVLPLLFLHRAGKLPCFKNSNTTGQ